MSAAVSAQFSANNSFAWLTRCLRNVLEHRQAGCFLELPEHMIFAEMDVPRQLVKGQVARVVPLDIGDYLLHEPLFPAVVVFPRASAGLPFVAVVNEQQQLGDGHSQTRLIERIGHVVKPGDLGQQLLRLLFAGARQPPMSVSPLAERPEQIDGPGQLQQRQRDRLFDPHRRSGARIAHRRAMTFGAVHDDQIPGNEIDSRLADRNLSVSAVEIINFIVRMAVVKRICPKAVQPMRKMIEQLPCRYHNAPRFRPSAFVRSIGLFCYATIFNENFSLSRYRRYRV